MSSSYTLDVNPLLVISFTNNFYHLVGCLFALFMVSFAVQKTLSVIRSYFLNFCFHFLCIRENYIPKIDIIYVKYLEKEMAIHYTTLAWKISWTEEPGRLQSMGLVKCQTRLSNFTFTLHFHALEKEMATCSSVLALRIPGMGEPGGLLSMGSHRVKHN